MLAPNGRGEVLEVERLAEHGVHARTHLRRDLARARQHHDPHGQLERLDVVQEVEAAGTADMDVEDDDVDPACGQELPRGVDGRGLEHGVALELQVHAAEQAQRRVVVDDEDGPASKSQLGLHRAAHRSDGSTD